MNVKKKPNQKPKKPDPPITTILVSHTSLINCQRKMASSEASNKCLWATFPALQVPKYHTHSCCGGFCPW